MARRRLLEAFNPNTREMIQTQGKLDFSSYDYCLDIPRFKKMFPGNTPMERKAQIAAFINSNKENSEKVSKQILCRVYRALGATSEFIYFLNRNKRRRFRLPVPYPFED